MINKIILASAERIKALYKDIRIYTEEVEQGFNMPCFSIILRELGSEVFRGRRHRLKAEIEVHYYNGKKRENYNDIITGLVNALEYIKVDSFPLRPVNISAKTESDSVCLKLLFDFFYITDEKEDTELMGEYNEKITVK